MTHEQLVTELKNQTTILKDEYVEKCGQWAKTRFERSIEMLSWNEERWCKYFGIEAELKDKTVSSTYNSFPLGFKGFPRNFYNSKDSREYYSLRIKAQSLKKKGLDKYVEEEKAMAIIHYNLSIEKLAIRITKKGLNLSSISIKTAHVGVNIESIITDGVKTIKAWTIVASGDIQKPHYRYLIK